MIFSATHRNSVYRHRWRPSRYWLAAALGLAILVVLVASSVATLAVGSVPISATVFGLPSAICAAAATVFFLRALHDHSTVRGRDLTPAIVLLLIGAVLWVSVLDAYTFTQAAGPVVAALCTAACVPTSAAGLVALHRLDWNKPEPWRLVLVATGGAIVSTSLAFWAETLWDLSVTSNLLPGPAVVISNAYSAAIFEEVAKGITVLLLYVAMRDEFDSVVDGIVYGAAVGLGFNFVESIAYMTHYYALFAPEGTGVLPAIGQWYGRQVIGLFLGQAAYTALTGAGIGIARQLPRAGQRVLVIVCGFLAAIAAHFAWNALQDMLLSNVNDPLASALLSQARYVIIIGPFVAVLLVLLAMGLQIESVALKRHLCAEAESGSGAVELAEVEVLISPKRRFQARITAFASGGISGYLRAAHLQAAQLDLAVERRRLERQGPDNRSASEDLPSRNLHALHLAELWPEVQRLWAAFADGVGATFDLSGVARRQRAPGESFESALSLALQRHQDAVVERVETTHRRVDAEE